MQIVARREMLQRKSAGAKGNFGSQAAMEVSIDRRSVCH
jgi:hypothetical protein